MNLVSLPSGRSLVILAFNPPRNIHGERGCGGKKKTSSSINQNSSKIILVEGEFWWKVIRPQGLVFGIVCEVRTQDPENFDEEVKSLLTACRPVGEGI